MHLIQCLLRHPWACCQVAIAGATVLVSFILVKSLQLILWWSIRRWNPRHSNEFIWILWYQGDVTGLWRADDDTGIHNTTGEITSEYIPPFGLVSLGALNMVRYKDGTTGIHRRPVNSPHKWPVTRKKFPFYDVIMRSQTVNTEAADCRESGKVPCSTCGVKTIRLRLFLWIAPVLN